MSDAAASGPEWSRVRELFQGALERQGTARSEYLTEACRDDQALRQEVESLLAHVDGGVLGEPAESGAPQIPGDTTFGDYRLLRLLGQGGMGTVYLAERVGEGFTQQVALKLLRRDLFHSLAGTPGLDQRFGRERRILARLEHPGIARLIDGGYGPEGQPYLAMEFVEGETLLDFAQARSLGVEARVELFIAVTEAVHYAHQRLVIHRDLKPGNILITPAGDPKLLDFGIATLGESDEGPRPGDSLASGTGLWFTPSYASPEQVRGERVTTLSDIYSLGVLLYELLAGARPYDVNHLSPRAIEEIVCGRIPERPSDRAGDAGVARRLRGDLDTIVLKALAKEPERRYRSAQDLAEDLRRHLAHEPVSARPDSLGYRTTTFVRRHRPAVAAGVMVLIALTGGLITARWQARVAAAAQVRSEQVTDFLISLFSDSEPGGTQVDPAYVAAVAARGAARVEELRDQPEVQARLLDALGLLQLSFGRRQEAEDMIRRSLALRREHYGPLHPDVAMSVQHLAQVARVNGQYVAAESLLSEALSIFRRTTGPESMAYTDALSDLGFLLPYVSRTPEAEATYREVLAIRRRHLPPDDPAISRAILRVAATLRAQGKLAAAESAGREALQIRRQRYGVHDARVGEVLVILGDIVAKDSTRWNEADSLYRTGIEIQRYALGDQYIGLGHGMGNLAQVLRRQHHYAEAEMLLRRVLALRVAAFGADNIQTIADRGALADVLADQGHLTEAIAMREGVAADLTRTLGPDHPVIAGGLADLAALYLKVDNLVAAESLLTRAAAIRRRGQGPTNPNVGRLMATLGEISLRRRDYPAAEQRLTDALGIMRQAPDATPGEIAQIRRNLALTYRSLNRPADAARYTSPE